MPTRPAQAGWQMDLHGWGLPVSRYAALAARRASLEGGFSRSRLLGGSSILVRNYTQNLHTIQQKDSAVT